MTKKWILVSLPEQLEEEDAEILAEGVSDHFQSKYPHLELDVSALSDQELVDLSEQVGDDMATTEDDEDDEADDDTFSLPG